MSTPIGCGVVGIGSSHTRQCWPEQQMADSVCGSSPVKSSSSTENSSREGISGVKTKRVWKYRIPIGEVTTLNLPKNPMGPVFSPVRFCTPSYGTNSTINDPYIEMWVEVVSDPSPEDMITVALEVIGTNMAISSHACHHGTVIDPTAGLVWHVYEVPIDRTRQG